MKARREYLIDGRTGEVIITYDSTVISEETWKEYLRFISQFNQEHDTNFCVSDEAGNIVKL